jgi:hypothetical protein
VAGGALIVITIVVVTTIVLRLAELMIAAQ